MVNHLTGLNKSFIPTDNLLVEKYSNYSEHDKFGQYDNYNFLLEKTEPEKEQLSLLLENVSGNVSGVFASIAFPLIKRTFDNIISKSLVTFYPIDKASSKIFFFYPKVSSRRESGGKQIHIENTSDYKCLGLNCPEPFVESCKSFYDQLYNDSFYDQSKGAYEVIVATGTPFSFDADSCIVPYTDVTSQDNTIRAIGFKITGLNNKPVFSNGRGNEIAVEEFITSFRVINSGAPIVDSSDNVIYQTGDEVKGRFFAQKYGDSIVHVDDLCDENGYILYEIDLKHPVSSGNPTTYDGYVGVLPNVNISSNFTFTWKRYDTLENNGQISEYGFDLRGIDLQVVDRMTRAIWSPQLQMDLQAYQNINANKEFINSMSQQIALEIDREILLDLKNAAPWALRFDYLGWQNTTQTYNQELWNKKLFDKINEVSAQIHKTTNCGGANWVVLSPEASALFPNLSILREGETLTEKDRYNIGLKRVGTLGGRYDVFIDAFAKPNDILIGFKPESLTNVGYIYAPYVLAQPSVPVMNPNNFSINQMLMTRYAKKFTNSKMYGKIYVDNIPTFNTFESR